MVPSATDSVTIFGSGTDASPGFTTIFNTDGSYRFNTVAGDVSTGFSFYMLATNSTTGVTYTGFALEVMLTNSAPASDLDPAVIYAGTPSNTHIFGSDMATGARGFLGSLTAAAFVIVPSMVSSVFPAAMGGQNAWSTKDDSVNILWARGATSPYGAKGYGAFLTWNGPSHNNYDTVSINSAKDHIYINGCLLPWDGSVPLI